MTTGAVSAVQYGPQWSPGLMAGGSPMIGPLSPVDQALPQWSPGLMAGGRCSCTVRRQGGHCRNGAPA